MLNKIKTGKGVNFIILYSALADGLFVLQGYISHDNMENEANHRSSGRNDTHFGRIEPSRKESVVKSTSDDVIKLTSDDSGDITESSRREEQTSHFIDNVSPDSDYRSDLSPCLDGEDQEASSDPETHVTRSYDSDRNSDWFRHRCSKELKTGSAWPLAEGNGWTPKPSNEEDTSLTSSRSTSNYNTLSQNSGTPSESEKEDTPFKFSKLTRDQKVILLSTSLTNLLSFLSLSILAPFFPLEADKKGVSNTISGWIFGVFALVQFLTSPLFGRLIPICGSRFMYLAGLFICSGCTLCFGVLDRVDTSEGSLVFIIMCFVTRILLSLGCTSLNNAGFVMLVRAFPDNVGTVFGIGEIFTGIGMVTGPALGGFLYDAGGFILPFAVISVSGLVALPLIGLLLPAQDDSQESESEDMSLLKVVIHPKSLVNSLVVVVAASIWAVLDPTLEPHLRVYGLGPSIVGVLFLIMAAFYSISSPLWGWLADKLPDNRVLLIPGFLLAAAGLLLSGPSPALGFDLSYNELWLTILSLIILGVASAMCVIPTYDIYIEVLSDIGYPEDTRTYGMVSGLWVSMYALGDFAGPSLGGFLDEEIGFEWLTTWFAAACAMTSVIIVISWYIEAKCRKRKTVPDDTTPIIGPPTGDEDSLCSYPPQSISGYNSS